MKHTIPTLSILLLLYTIYHYYIDKNTKNDYPAVAVEHFESPKIDSAKIIADEKKRQIDRQQFENKLSKYISKADAVEKIPAQTIENDGVLKAATGDEAQVAYRIALTAIPHFARNPETIDFGGDDAIYKVGKKNGTYYVKSWFYSNDDRGQRSKNDFMVTATYLGGTFNDANSWKLKSVVINDVPIYF